MSLKIDELKSLMANTPGKFELPSSGQIAMSDIMDELGVSGQQSLRGLADLAGFADGEVTFSDFHGFSSVHPVTLPSGSQSKVNLDSYLDGWNGTAALAITVPADALYTSDTTGTPALVCNPSQAIPAGSTIVVTAGARVYGAGGAGGAGGNGRDSNNITPGAPGAAGGVGLQHKTGFTISNNGDVKGGGGGGGGGSGGNGVNGKTPYWHGGGGGGGGASYGGGGAAGSSNNGTAGGGGTATATSGGGGGAAAGSASGAGGTGGAPGSAGTSGGAGNSAGGAGGAAGAAIQAV